MSTQNGNDNTDKSNSDTKITRRKAVKTIAGGITALAAYHTLPAKWEKPILESIFLPAHAQTSGNGIAPVDPSIPVTPGHPDHPDYPLAPNHPDHPHNNPMAVIGGFTTDAIIPPDAAISVDITINRIAQYTFTLVNLENSSSTTRPSFTAQTIPITLSPRFFVAGKAGDTVELTVTNNLTSEVDTARYVIESTVTITVATSGGCNSSISLGGNAFTNKSFTAKITPNPGAGQPVTLEDIKDGTTVVTVTKNTDANGEVSQLILIQNTDIGSAKGLRATYQGTVGSCTVNVET